MEATQNTELFDRIIEKQLELLKKHGAEFIVKKNNGDIITHGDSLKLYVEPPVQEPVKKPRVFKVKMGEYLEVYKDVIECMQPGDSYTFDVPEKFEVESVRGAACGFATRLWGRRTYTTRVNPAARQFTLERYPTVVNSDEVCFTKLVQEMHDRG